MIAEILATGDEIRSGALIDTNSAYIARKLEEVGVAVVRHSCVGDDLDLLVAIFREIGQRSDVAVVTGGLGPTDDDLTAAAAAKAVAVDLVLDRPALEAIEKFFKAHGRAMSPSNKKQALLPRGAECLYNPIGTAPGFVLQIERCMFYFMPGVPHEMRRMLSDSVLPRILNQQGGRRDFYRAKTLATFGLTESATNDRLRGFEKVFPDIKLGLRAKFPEIQVKLYAGGRDAAQLENRLESACRWIVTKIGDRIFSVDGDPMETVVGRLLVEKNATLAVAESCTGGLISHLLTNVPGSSEYFLFSGVTYSNRAKEQVLGVAASTLKRYGAVHAETAKAMAQGARRLCDATYGLATSGIAGPDGGTAEKPVGTVCIGLASARGVFGRQLLFPAFNRTMNKQIFAMGALDLLRREILSPQSMINKKQKRP